MRLRSVTVLAAALVFSTASPAQESTLGPDVAATVGPPSGAALSGSALDRRLEELAPKMRCPVCQGHSIADSPSESARNMKAQVRALLAGGYDDEQIFSYFEAGYGEFIRMSPKPRGWNLLAWAIPAGGILAGLAIAWRVVTRSRPTRGAGTDGSETRAGEAGGPDADPWLERVRREVRDDSA